MSHDFAKVFVLKWGRTAVSMRPPITPPTRLREVIERAPLGAYRITGHALTRFSLLS